MAFLDTTLKSGCYICTGKVQARVPDAAAHAVHQAPAARRAPGPRAERAQLLQVRRVAAQLHHQLQEL